MKPGLYGRHRGLGEGKYVLNFSYIIWFGIAGIIAATTLLTFQQEQGFLYNTAMMQLMLGIFGLVSGSLFIAMGIYEFRMDRPEDIENYGIWSIIGFFGGRVASAIVGGVVENINLSSIWITNFTIVMTSAIFEEVIFNMFLATMIFIGIKQGAEKLLINLGLSEDVAEWITIIITGLIISWMFAVFHIGAYGTDMGILLYLAASRFVYTVIYLKSRNLLAPTYAHLFHNGLIIAMGVI